MIDFDRALQFNPEWRPDLAWSETSEQDVRETSEMSKSSEHSGNPEYGHQPDGVCRDVFCCQNDNIDNDYKWDRLRADDFYQEHEDASKGGRSKPIEEELALLPTRVFGFVLRSRKWANLHLDILTSVREDKEGFKRLRLPPGHDRILLGLVETHFHRRENNSGSDVDFGFDLVQAKGNGLIILLHGAPGVGKTSTAECIAAMSAKPLFPITCGDLGLTPSEVEENLDINFQLAQSWGCVLLLDEADVFLAERKKEDIQRNALVSVFLRSLEYYTGLLFLTTNRVGTIDEAFRSRIHMTLYYPPLDLTQTKAIWEDNLDKVVMRNKEMLVDRTEILRYAEKLHTEHIQRHKVGWNGRQIRNAFQTAVALAEHASQEATTNPEFPARLILKLQFFEDVAQALVNFEQYLQRTLEQKPTDYAQSQHWRADRYQGSNQNVASTWTTPRQASSLSRYQNSGVQPPSQFQAPQWMPGQNIRQQGMENIGQPWQGTYGAFERGQSSNSGLGFQGQQQNLQEPPMLRVFDHDYSNGMNHGYNQMSFGGQFQAQSPPPNNTAYTTLPQGNPQGEQPRQSHAADINSMGGPAPQQQQQGSNQFDPSKQQRVQPQSFSHNPGHIVSGQPGMMMQQGGYQQYDGSQGRASD